jgi:hypothetical protein
MDFTGKPMKGMVDVDPKGTGEGEAAWRPTPGMREKGATHLREAIGGAP